MHRLCTGAAMVAMVAAVPAAADVKAGVDAWGRGDYRRAVEEWRGPAVAGDADAQFNLGQAYKLGRGVPVDLPMAEEWYRKAAEQGHRQAADNYGLALFQNNKRDRAVTWLEKSAGRGEPRAQYVLGTMYFNADVVARDWVRAYALMTRASGAGLSQATATLAQMDRYISLSDRQKGTELARTLESEAGRATSPVVVAEAPARARETGRPTPRSTPRATAQPTAEVAEQSSARRPAAPRPTPVASAPTRAAPAPKTASGPFRVQLGAFRDEGNARALFAQLQRAGGFAGKTPYLVRAGALTRLQVGGFASSAEAERSCGPAKASGNPCVVVRG
ncbi:hypothetical protein SAMN06297144_2324 [Sphingomonas guangdongensis]|uniref:SPOR domain-containing protein n=1 Tax=Sphingomonas guangdongensis TaxID=1141890 RepID=A0A285QZ39_9SPHN|nr:SPOR domain-containing protein [Sphingomonas guangdongensis]SOB87200.1 hypothetical protein SAMN06297144_2324 [Sphingomonas guangdongensis]